jgi:hypothetical protein
VEVAAALLALAAEPDADVAAQAVGTLANMAVDFSAVKEQLLAADGVARFAALARAPTPALRLHGVWGLSSVAYMATPEVRPGVLLCRQVTSCEMCSRENIQAASDTCCATISTAVVI